MITEREVLTRRPVDLIESFLEYTDGISAPPIFRLWSAIGLVAGVLERKVYVRTTGEQLYPNLYILLVAPPGVGKTQAIKVVHEFWKKTPELVQSPDNLTKASLVDNLEKASRKLVLSPVDLLEFNSMQVAADELGVFLSAHDLDFLSFLNKIYDCPESYTEDRRMFKAPLFIPAPQLTILAGTQPAFMASILPEEAWGMGFTSRIIMLYSATKVKVSLFNPSAKDPDKFKAILRDLRAMMQMWGEFIWKKEAAEAIQEWDTTGSKKTEPRHTKLENYNPRRILHLLKLCMISSASRSNEKVITLADFDRALSWLVAAEITMPDVFRNMTQKSDATTIQELHFYAWQIYAKEKKDIHEARLIHFLQTKVPSDRVLKVLEIAERAGVLIRIAGTTNLYKPATNNATGLE